MDRAPIECHRSGRINGLSLPHSPTVPVILQTDVPSLPYEGSVATVREDRTRLRFRTPTTLLSLPLGLSGREGTGVGVGHWITGREPKGVEIPMTMVLSLL